MTQLRSVTCNMGSHSVTCCYPTQVNTSPPTLKWIRIRNCPGVVRNKNSQCGWICLLCVPQARLFEVSSRSVPLQERRRFNDFTPLFTVISSSAGPSPRFRCLRSFSTARNMHVWRGRPCRGRLHFFGGSSMPALRARVWSLSESEQTVWPKNLRRLSMTVWVTRGWAERRRTSWLVTRTVNGTRRMCRRHHWSNALSRLLDGPHRHVPHFWAV